MYYYILLCLLFYLLQILFDLYSYNIYIQQLFTIIYMEILFLLLYILEVGILQHVLLFHLVLSSLLLFHLRFDSLHSTFFSYHIQLNHKSFEICLSIRITDFQYTDTDFFFTKTSLLL